jgi:ABC-2 type transport system ATP-binding protein
MKPHALQVVGVTKSFGDCAALRSVTLSLSAGEVCGLLGRNGAGKTTLISIIGGTRAADDGTVRIEGAEISRRDRRANRMLGIAGQETAIYLSLSVRENLDFQAALAGMGRKAFDRRLTLLVDLFDLGDMIDTPTRRLSGGERRRVHIAMALVHEPSVLLLDEPTTGLDVDSRARLLAAIKDLAAVDGCAILYATHYLREVEDLNASVAILDRGRVLARGSLEQLVERHATAAVELTFDGPVPDEIASGAVVDGSRALIATRSPATTAADVLSGLGPGLVKLTSVELHSPGIDAVFAEVVGPGTRKDGEAGS